MESEDAQEREGERAPPRTTIEATLRSGGVETRYRKAGSGTPLLLLGAPGGASPSTLQLFERLSRHFRVIRPELPPAGGCVSPALSCASAWLRGIVDGLGLERCILLAEPFFSLSATWFAFTDPHRVARLVLLVPEGPDPALHLDEVRQVLQGTGQPVLLVRTGSVHHPDSLTEEVITRLVGLLEGDRS